jgi:hypothetical protein
MAEPIAATVPSGAMPKGSLLIAIARQRELSLIAIMLVLGGLVAVAAQFLTATTSAGRGPRLDTAVAVIQALVVITATSTCPSRRSWASSPTAWPSPRSHLSGGRRRSWSGPDRPRLDGQRLLVTVFKVPSIVATLTRWHLPWHDYLIASSLVPLAGLPRLDPAGDSASRCRRRRISRPWSSRRSCAGRSAARCTRSAAARGGRDPQHRRAAWCSRRRPGGLLAGVAGVMGGRSGRSTGPGERRFAIVAVVVGGEHLRRQRVIVGAVIGAMFRVRRQRPHPRRPVTVRLQAITGA